MSSITLYRLITSTSVNAHCLIPMKNAILMIPLKWLILKLINNCVYNLRVVVMSVWNMNSELNIHIVHSYDYTPLSSRAFWLWYITGEEREIRSKYSQQTGKESECWTHCRMDCAMLSLVISLISALPCRCPHGTPGSPGHQPGHSTPDGPLLCYVWTERERHCVTTNGFC